MRLGSQTSGTGQQVGAIGLPAVVCVALYLVNFDIGAANLAVSAIQTTFHVPLPTVVWFVDVYVLALACSALPSGLICDRLGASRTLLIGISGFTAASLFCGVAWSSTSLVAARLVQGCASGMTIPAAFATVASAYPDKRLRAKVVGYMAIAAGVGVASSPPVAGALISWLGWRSIFLINVPLTFVPIIALLCTKAPPQAMGDGHLPLGSIGSLITSLAGLAYLLIEWPKVLAGDKSLMLVVVVTLAALISFFRSERNAKSSLIPLGIYQDRRVMSLCWIGALNQGGAFAIMFLISLQKAQWDRLPPEMVGLLFVRLTGAVLVTSVGLGIVMHRLNTRAVAITGIAIYVVGLSILIVSTSAVSIAFPVLGTGMALLTPPISLEILRSVGPALAGTATGLLNTARQLGALIGIAASGAAILVSVRHQLGDAVPFDALLRAAAGDLAGLTPMLAEGARDGFDRAARAVFLTLATLLVVSAFVMSLFLKTCETDHG